VDVSGATVGAAALGAAGRVSAASAAAADALQQALAAEADAFVALQVSVMALVDDNIRSALPPTHRESGALRRGAAKGNAKSGPKPAQGTLKYEWAGKGGSFRSGLTGRRVNHCMRLLLGPHTMDNVWWVHAPWTPPRTPSASRR